MHKIKFIIKTFCLKLVGFFCKILLSDKYYLNLRYKRNFNKKLDLDNPRTFNEKIQWLKLYDRKDIYTTMVDKFLVRDYIKNKIGKEYLIPLLGVYDKFDDIDFDKLPNQFVIKCNHDSGGLVICKNKNTFNYLSAKKKINKSLNKNYYFHGREWPYKNVKPIIIIEKYMKDEKSNDLIDYKFMCFNGKIKYVFTFKDRTSDIKTIVYDENWERMLFGRKSNDLLHNTNKPINFEKMKKFSEKLAKGIPFIRVDWYEINGKLYFGELTFYPASGFSKFYPEKWDLELGEQLILPKEVSYEKKKVN